MGLRLVACCVLGFALAAGWTTTGSAAETLRVATYGGSFLEGQKSYLGTPFEMLTGANVQWIGGTGEIFASKLIVAAGKSPPYDIVMLDDPWYSVARAQGLLAKLDTAHVPSLAGVLPIFRTPDDVGTCVAGVMNGIAYNKDKFKEVGLPPPTRWQDLANPKLAGHVGTQTLAATAPQFLLAAYAIEEGLAPTDWDRAIDEVAKIKFHSFSSGVADLMAKMEAGDVWAAPMADGRAMALIGKGLPIGFVLPDNGNGTKGGISCGTMNIAKGSPVTSLAERFLAFAISPGPQLMQAAAPSPFGPVIGGLDPILAKAPAIGGKIAWGPAVTHAFRLSWNGNDVTKFTDYVAAWNRKVQK